MFGWNAKTPDGRTFGDIYRDQYRQQRERPGLRAGLGAGVMFPSGGGLWLFGHHLAIAYIVLCVAVVLLAAAIVLARRERHAHGNDDPAHPVRAS